MSFADLKKNSKKVFTQMQQKSNAGYEARAAEFWKPKLDKKVGNAYAVIRFLPPPEGEEKPYVEIFTHNFQDKNTKRWYIENSLTTIGQKDPVSEENTRIWKIGTEEAKSLARERKRKHRYISNILVISDPANPENEGKVFKYEYGPKIFEKIQSALEPQYQDEEPMNPFDFWEGADFVMKAGLVSNQWSYDRSAFKSPSPLLDGDDEALEKLWKSQYSLAAEIAPDKFKSYEKLKERFDFVTGKAGDEKSETSRHDDADEYDDEPKPAPAVRQQTPSPNGRFSRQPQPQRQVVASSAQKPFEDDDLGDYSSLLDD